VLIQLIQQSKPYQHAQKLGGLLNIYFPAIFFFGGFLWDALTIGRNVGTSDLITFVAYLLLAGLILFVIGRPSYVLANTSQPPAWLPAFMQASYKRLHYPNLPYFLLQFIYGNLLSSLFILYFKSANHWLTWLMSIVMAALLVANEFLESEYRRFTLSWALFGLCAMLVLNFVLPCVLGSIHAVWFYISTFLGALAAHYLYKKTPNHFGSIMPVWAIAGLLMLAYAADMIPPVPLVKREIAMSYDVQKVGTNYQLSQQASPWWIFWRKTSDNLQVLPGQRVYCFSSIFAPAGLSTKLFHNWQLHTKKGWVTQSRAGFPLNGGRYGGYRGYTFKSNIAAGNWRVSIETEDGKTLAIQSFTVEITLATLQKPIEKIVQNY
jgi:hypothetical protein